MTISAATQTAMSGEMFKADPHDCVVDCPCRWLHLQSGTERVVVLGYVCEVRAYVCARCGFTYLRTVRLGAREARHRGVA